MNRVRELGIASKGLATGTEVSSPYMNYLGLGVRCTYMAIEYSGTNTPKLDLYKLGPRLDGVWA